jgi:hypothetical protein
VSGLARIRSKSAAKGIYASYALLSIAPENRWPLLSTAKPLPEHEVSRDVVIQTGRPITHVLRFAPVTLLPTGLCLPHRLAPRTDVLDDEGLGVAERVVGEGVVKDAAAEGMSGPVDFQAGAEGTGGVVDSAVPLGFAGVGALVGVGFFLPRWIDSFEAGKDFSVPVGKVDGYE